MLSSNSLWGKIITYCQGIQKHTSFYFFFLRILTPNYLINCVILETPNGVQCSGTFIRQWNETRPALSEGSSNSKLILWHAVQTELILPSERVFFTLTIDEGPTFSLTKYARNVRLLFQFYRQYTNFLYFDILILHVQWVLFILYIII